MKIFFLIKFRRKFLGINFVFIFFHFVHFQCPFFQVKNWDVKKFNIFLKDNDFFYLIKKNIKKYCFYKDKIDFEVDVSNLIRWVVKG